MTNARALARAILASLPALARPAALAQATVPFGPEHDASLPVEITSDRLDLDQAAGTAVFAGNVKVGQGAAPRGRPAEVFTSRVCTRRAGEVERMVATGNVTLSNGAEAAEADQAVYEVAGGTSRCRATSS